MSPFPRRHLSARTAVLLALGLAGDGCRDPLSPAEETARATEAAKVRWAAAQLQSYSFTAFRSCECLPDWVGPVRVSVIAGNVAAVTMIGSGAPVPADRWFDVDELFALIDRELVQQPSLLEVTFDPVRGYPTRVKWGAIEVDAGAVITISAFAPG